MWSSSLNLQIIFSWGIWKKKQEIKISKEILGNFSLPKLRIEVTFFGWNLDLQ